MELVCVENYENVWDFESISFLLFIDSKSQTFSLKQRRKKGEVLITKRLQQKKCLFSFSTSWIARFFVVEKFEEPGSEAFKNSFCLPRISPRRLVVGLSSNLTIGLTRATGLCALETLRISAASSRLIPLREPTPLLPRGIRKCKLWKSIFELFGKLS